MRLLRFVNKHWFKLAEMLSYIALSSCLIAAYFNKYVITLVLKGNVLIAIALYLALFGVLIYFELNAAVRGKPNKGTGCNGNCNCHNK